MVARAYQFEPSEIQVSVNRPVRFVVRSADIDHTFDIKADRQAQEMLVNLAVPAGRTVSVSPLFLKNIAGSRDVAFSRVLRFLPRRNM